MTVHAPTTVERPLSALDAIYGRRSIRAYVGPPLPATTVRALLDAAVQAPTAMHREPWAFAVVQDRSLLQRLGERVKALALAADAHLGSFAETLRDREFDPFYGAGTLIVIASRRKDPFAIADCWLAAENLMLAAAALGLGTCCIGLAIAALNERDMKRALDIPADVYPVAAIVAGVPRGTAAPVSRREPEIVSWK